MNYKQIVERLSLLRTKKNLSSRELGGMIGNSDTYFYKVEDNTIILNLPKFLEILEALEISTEEFFYEDLDKYKKDKELLDVLHSLSKEELDALITLLKRKR